MKLGPCVSHEMYPTWRFVESDLYGITDHVTERDKDCRLGWNEETTQFGLFRDCETEGIGRAWLLGRKVNLYGYVPDARIVEEQRESDLWTKQHPHRHKRAMAQGLHMHRQRAEAARRDEMGEPIERFVDGARRQMGATQDHIYVPNARAS